MAAQRALPTKATPKQRKILATVADHPGLSNREIAKIAGVSHPHVIETLQTYGIIKETIDKYKEHRADIFAGVQERVLSTLTLDEIKKASIKDRTILLGTLYDKERLERGLSTSNTLIACILEEADSEPDLGPGPQDIVVEADSGDSIIPGKR